MDEKNILLLGGTGAMGEYLTKILTKKNFTVYITTRQQKRISSSNNICYIYGNAMEDSFLIKILSEKHYDAIVDFMIYTPSKFSERLNLLLASTKHYVFLSSSRVYASTSGLISEDSPRLLDTWKGIDYLSTDEYALSKAREEDLLRENNKNNWTIIRPYITYSSNRLQLGVMEKESWLQRTLEGKTIIFSRDILPHETTLTYGYDVSKGIAAIIGNDKAYGETFHITQPKSQTWGEILEIYLDTLEQSLGKRPKVFLTETSLYRNKLGRKWQVEVDRLYDRKFDNTKINEFIDTSTFLNPKEGLKICLQDFLKSPKFLSYNYYENLLFDKISGDFSSPSHFESKISYIKYLIKRTIYPFSKI